MTYQEFATFLFDRSTGLKEWYFAEDFLPPTLEASDQVDFATKVFQNAEYYANKFTETQWSLAHNYLINSTCSYTAYSYFDTSVADSARISLLESMQNVFDTVFQKRCTGTASGEHAVPGTYNYICHMWWHVLPRHGIPRDSLLESSDQVILSVLRKTLSLSNLACKRSALHGLGHWHAAYPDLVEQIISQYSTHIPPALASYADSAKSGRVQ
jgi:hypothetical protein